MEKWTVTPDEAKNLNKRIFIEKTFEESRYHSLSEFAINLNDGETSEEIEELVEQIIL